MDAARPTDSHQGVHHVQSSTCTAPCHITPGQGCPLSSFQDTLRQTQTSLASALLDNDLLRGDANTSVCSRHDRIVTLSRRMSCVLGPYCAQPPAARTWPSRPFESKLLLPCLGLSTLGRGICSALELQRCQCVWPQLSGSWHTLHSSRKLLFMHGCHSDSRPLVDVLYLHRNLSVRFGDGDRFRQGHIPTFLFTRRCSLCSLLLPVPVCCGRPLCLLLLDF